MAQYQVRRRIYNGGNLQSDTLLGQPTTQCLATERLLREVGVDIDPTGLNWKYSCGTLDTTPDTKCNTQDPNSNLSRNYIVVQV